MLGAPNGALWWVTGAGAVSLVLLFVVPFVRRLFRFGALHLDDAAPCWPPVS